jgi:hypothetical protein
MGAEPSKPSGPAGEVKINRETILRRDGLPQGIDQAGHDEAAVIERPQVDLPHRLLVARKFFAKLHAWMVRTPPGSSRTLLSPDGQRCPGR